MSLRVSKPEFNIREKLNELDRPVGTQGNSILQSNTIAESFNKIQAGRRNVIINGDMSISQRGTSTTGITGDTYGACDRWEVDLAGAGTWTMEQVGDAPYNTGFTHCTSLTCTTAVSTISSHIALRQKIEKGNIKGLMGGTSNAKPLTVSFWAKSNEPGKYYVLLYRARTGLSSSRISISYTIEQSEVWEFKTITFPPDTMNGYQTTDNATGLEIHFSLGMNQSSYGGAHEGHWSTNDVSAKGILNLAAATGNYWRVTGVQLEIGNEHTEFDHRLLPEELALCQRYFIKDTMTREGSGYGVVTGALDNIVGIQVDFPVTMRVTPSLSLLGTTYRTGGNSDAQRVTNTGFIWGRKQVGGGTFHGAAYATGGYQVDAEM